jgi:hypothetical protein
MRRPLRWYLTLVWASVLAFGTDGQAQNATQDHAAEVKAEVPALTAFHPVIYEIWHGAWPQKDVARLAALLPRVESGVKSIADAQLPGILRDHKDAWEENIRKLQAVAADYRTCVQQKDDQKLLDAAEKLHSQYERLVRVIRPALRELEDFHAVLYVLYHYQLPGDSLERMKRSAAALQEKMVALDKAALPERLKSKDPAFTRARTQLSKSVAVLASSARTDDLESIKAAVAKVHADYQALERVFD